MPLDCGPALPFPFGTFADLDESCDASQLLFASARHAADHVVLRPDGLDAIVEYLMNISACSRKCKMRNHPIGMAKKKKTFGRNVI